MSNIAVAVSGGADSLYALVSLYEQGHKVMALHGIFLQEANNSHILKLEKICKKLNIPLNIIDLRTQFNHLVIEPFVKSYAMGHTPNPCAICNKHIKFGLLMDEALRLKADFLATGHYVTKNNTLSQLHGPLSKGKDERKEQSYFLALVPKKRLDKCIFPLGSLEKNFIIKYLEDRNYTIPIKKESQEICFVPQDAYRPFLQAKANELSLALSGTGPMLIYEGNGAKCIGQHKGLWQYTEGQRRGLNVAWSEPLYVRAKESATNSLILGTANDLALSGCIIKKFNILVSKEYWPKEIFAKVRYRQKEAPANYTWLEDSLRIDFKSAQSPTACGQIAAIYDANGQLLGGGIIEEVF